MHIIVDERTMINHINSMRAAVDQSHDMITWYDCLVRQNLEMPSQQATESARCVPDPFLLLGWGLGTRLLIFSMSLNF